MNIGNEQGAETMESLNRPKRIEQDTPQEVEVEVTATERERELVEA